MSSNTKKINKQPKQTRTQKKLQNLKKIPQFPASKPNFQLFQGKKPQTQKSRFSLGKSLPSFFQQQPSSQQKNNNIVVNLNLGLYGFDANISQQFQFQYQSELGVEQKLQSDLNLYGKIEEIITNCLIFAQNPNIQGIEWKEICEEMREKLEQEGYLANLVNCWVLVSGNSSRVIEINKHQYNLWDCLHELFTKIKQGSSSPGLSGIVQSQTLQVKNFLAKSKNQFLKIVQLDKWRQISSYRQKLYKLLAFKCFSYGLQDIIIDQLNYFLQKQFQQNSRNYRNVKNQTRIKNWSQWADFIQKKRVRLRKANKFLLHTACQLCLSPYSQLANPIQNCPQCHIRGHRLCLDTSNSSRCGRCIYLRLSNQVKDKIPQCFICGVKNLVPLKVASSKFVHIFCILAHGLWRIREERISTLVNYQEMEKEKQINKKICKFCNNSTEHYTKCEECQYFCHYLCAYLNGACFEVYSQNNIKVHCCRLSSSSAERLAYQRKYVLNYNNTVFKKLNQIQHSLKSTKKGRKRLNMHYIPNQVDNNGQQQMNMLEQQNLYNEMNQISHPHSHMHESYNNWNYNQDNVEHEDHSQHRITNQMHNQNKNKSMIQNQNQNQDIYEEMGQKYPHPQ